MAAPADRRARLEEELEAALRRAGVARAAIVSVVEGGCRLDGPGAAAVDEGLAKAEARLAERVRALARALDRLDRGEGGRCEACGGEIAPDRLDVLPTTTRCRSCAEES